MTILLFGADGQVGWELRRSLAPLGTVVALVRDPARNPDGLSGDLTDPNSIKRTVETVRPDWIVNAAAYTAVDRAESESATVHTVNADSPAALAAAADALGAWLAHYSTDYVFDGSGDAPWTEDAPTAPLNAYGRTKAAGEAAIRDSGCRHLILRTSWVFGARGGNFAKTMLRLAAERDTLSVVADQIGAPTGAELIADATAQAMARAGTDDSGTYHLAAGGETDWASYARFAIAEARTGGLSTRAASEDVRGIASADYPVAATRPLNSRLDTAKFRRTFGLTLPDWQIGVRRMIAEHIGRG